MNIIFSVDDDNGDDVGCPMHRTNPAGQDEPSTGCLPTADDTEVLEMNSSETIIPDPVVSGARGAIIPPAADRAKATPASGGSR
jgi:hypothetical protein